MKNIKSVLLVVFGVVSSLAKAGAEKSPPNVVFILADDLGIMDVGAFASHFSGKRTEELFYETPHLDALVGRGISFSQAYANQLCSPTRAAILTGQIASRLGVTTATPMRKTYYNQSMEVPEGASPHDVLEHKDPIKEEQAWVNGKTNTAVDPGLMTLPKVLASHDSAFLGKWHLGGHGALSRQPAVHGFEELDYADVGGSIYFKWAAGWNRKNPFYETMPAGQFQIGKANASIGEDYLTDDLTARAVRYLEERAKTPEKPFFLYFNHFAVHTPIQAPEETIAKFSGKKEKGTGGHDNATYAAMVKHLDDSVGAIMKSLSDLGLAKNTLVVFTSDNGGVEYTNPAATDNFPFKGGKACLYEGGVRVPLVYFQPGKFEGGVWCDTPVDCTDFLPTLAELTGNKVPDGVDGRSSVALLKEPEMKHDPRTLIWHYPFNVIVKHPDNGLPLTPHSAIRVGDHKLIWDWHGKLELYNIPKDPYEKNDLAGAKPELQDRLFKELKSWLKANVKEQYFPVPNPNYDAKKDGRKYPFKDLSKGV